MALSLSEADVDRLLTPGDAIEAVEDSFRRLAAGTIENVPRYRGKVNRRLRVLALEGEPPAPETPVVHGEKEVGRVTSSVPGLALAYVRVEVPDDADLTVAGNRARLHWPSPRP